MRREDYYKLEALDGFHIRDWGLWSGCRYCLCIQGQARQRKLDQRIFNFAKSVSMQGKLYLCSISKLFSFTINFFQVFFFIQRTQLLPPTILANIIKFLYILSITCIPHFPYRRCVYSTSQTAIQSWKLASYFVTQAKISVSRKTGNMLMTRGVDNCFDFMPEATQQHQKLKGNYHVSEFRIWAALCINIF